MMKTVCAWHPKYFPNEEIPVLREEPNEQTVLSHGMCLKCFIELMEGVVKEDFEVQDAAT